MKQGKTEKAVFAKLSAEKVELRAQIVNDVIEQINYARRSWSAKYEAAGNALEKLYDELKMSISKTEYGIEMAEDGIRKAKELGADDVIKDLERAIKYAKEDLQSAKRLMGAIDKVEI